MSSSLPVIFGIASLPLGGNPLCGGFSLWVCFLPLYSFIFLLNERSYFFQEKKKRKKPLLL